MSSPVFTTNEAFSGRPPVFGADGSVMTFDNTVRKTVGTFGVVVLGAILGWMFVPMSFVLPLAIAGLVLGLVQAFKKEPSVPLIMAYAAVEGLFLGAITQYLEQLHDGIAMQAVTATLVVVATTLALFKSGKFRTSPKMTKIFFAAMIGYLAFSLVNLGLMWTGIDDSMWGLRSSVEVFGIPLGLLLGVFAVLMGAYSLVMDFEFVENGVRNRLPEKYGWTAAFGITVTVIWIYIEILRLISILRR